MNVKDSINKLIKNRTAKIVIGFTILATMQFFYFFANYGPLTFPDSGAHIAGSYSLASGQSLTPTLSTTDRVEVSGVTGAYGTKHLQKINLPENLSKEHNSTFKNNMLITTLVNQIKDDMRDSQKSELGNMDKSKSTVSVYTQANQYYPLSYAPTAIGMKAGMLLGKSSWGILQLARISNFLFYLAIMIAAIVMLPKGKLALTAIGLFPLSVFCGSSLMVDSFLIALCALYVSIALYFIINNRSIEIKHAVGIAVLTVVIMLVKVPYGALALIYICMPKHLWKTKPKATTCSITILVFLIVYATWSSSYQLIFVFEEVDYYAQMNYFIHHPLSVLLNCLINSQNFILATILHDFPQMFIYFAIIVFGIILTFEQKMTIFASTSILSTILVVVATYLFLFLTCTNYQGISPHFIQGFQERYLLPLLPLLLVMCQKQRGHRNLTEAS